VSIIDVIRDLDKLGDELTSTDPFEEIDTGDGKTTRPTFIIRPWKPILEMKLSVY
jgi:hypothetical protein